MKTKNLNPGTTISHLSFLLPHLPSWQSAICNLSTFQIRLWRIGKFIVFTMAMVFFISNVNVQGQGNPQAAWLAVGNDTVRTWRFTDVNNSLRITEDAGILGNARIDSILSSWQAIVDDALSVGSNITVGGNLTVGGSGTIAGNFSIDQGLAVTGQTQTGSLLVNQESILGIASAFKLTADSIVAGYLSATEIFASTIDVGNLSVSGNSQFNGLVGIGSTLILNGTNSSISSTTGTVDFLNSGFTTTANISADTINGNVLNTGSMLTGDITTGNVTANSIVSGNMAVQNKITVGDSTLILEDNSLSGITNSIYTTDSALFLQSNPGNIFNTIINAGNELNPGFLGLGTYDPQKMLHVFTVHHGERGPLPPPIPVPGPVPGLGGSHYGMRLEDHTISNLGTTISIWDLEPKGGNLVIGTPGDPKMTLSDTGIGIGREPEVALDVAGDVRASGSVTASNLNVSNAAFDSMHVQNKITVGDSTLILEDDPSLGITNSIYTTDDALFIQSNPGNSFNTIINAGTGLNPGFLGVGTTSPQKMIHVFTVHQVGGVPLPPRIPVFFPGGGSHYGVRLEDHTATNLGTTISVWDIEPKGSNLIIGTPGDPMLTLSKTGRYIFHGLADLTPPIVQYRPVVVDPVGKLAVLPPEGPFLSATFDNLQVNHILRVGTSSLVLDGSTTQTGPNSIYSIGGDLKIQQFSTFNTVIGGNNNTIIGPSNLSLLGLGTNSPQKKLHIKTSHSIPPPCPTPPCPPTEAPPSGLSHQGIRLEDEFIGGLGVTSSVWDIEPDGKTSKLHIGNPEDTVMTMTFGGNVGIGTSNPQKKLHVKTEHEFQFSWDFGTFIPFIPCWLQSPPTCPIPDTVRNTRLTHGGIRLEDEIKLRIINQQGELFFDTIFSKWDIEPIFGNLHIRTQDNTVMTFISNGNIGIGTVSPGAKLDVNGSINATNYLKNGQAFAGEWQTSGNDIFNTNTGNVGIGTTSPEKIVDIKNTVCGTPNGIRIESYVPSLFFKNNNSCYTDGHNWHISVAEVGTNATLAFKDETATAYRMVIDGSGNVGIGTTSPQAKLHIKVDNDADIALAVYSGSTENFRITGEGKFFARGYRIKLGGFPDYVFDKEHKRMTFEERALYYLKYGRMPMMPSAEDREEGLDVGNTLIGLTFNLEEIALNQNDLYKMIIEQKREIELLKRKIELLKKQ